MESQEQSESTNTVLEDQKFVISGVFQTISREGLKEKIESMGGTVVGSISAKTNYLVAGEGMGPWTQAMKLWVLEGCSCRRRRPPPGPSLLSPCPAVPAPAPPPAPVPAAAGLVPPTRPLLPLVVVLLAAAFVAQRHSLAAATIVRSRWVKARRRGSPRSVREAAPPERQLSACSNQLASETFR